MQLTLNHRLGNVMDELDRGVLRQITPSDGTLKNLFKRRKFFIADVFFECLVQGFVVPGGKHEALDHGEVGGGDFLLEHVHGGEEVAAEGAGVGDGRVIFFIEGVEGGFGELGLVVPAAVDGGLAGFGVSGDGIDQDDVIAASGTENFLPPENIRADRMFYRNARLPYAKFPRNPAL